MSNSRIIIVILINLPNLQNEKNSKGKKLLIVEGYSNEEIEL
ncbi:hypothetical protein JOC73_000967 [Alkaliphilus hydrothermalis]|uniref:Uncharacterized protein n=1 Tax=Alkaliphilus hydrothermalis TaxID=1482730 RepID=A0ABS2NNF7_9FIRM|nr:hypothetical protein [Alkaliphilus hydrothermalis]